MPAATISMNNGVTTFVLTLVNNDNYSSEYRLKGPDREHLAFVRHSTEKAAVLGQIMERHNVSYRETVYPTEIFPQGRIFESYFVIRAPKLASAADSALTAKAVMAYGTLNAEALIGWTL